MYRMKDLILLRKMISVMFNDFDKQKNYQTREKFIEYFAQNNRGKLYQQDTLSEYQERANRVLGTQIPARGLKDNEKLDEYYIGYNDDGTETLLVAKKGIRFIDPWWIGFIELVILEHPGITKYLIGGGIIAAVIELIQRLL